MVKYLIVNSDDFGISEDVSRGIMEAHQKGIVTSTSTMVNMPAAAEAIATAQSTCPNLGLGLHLTLSFGKPVSEPETVPSLVTKEGRFVSTYGQLIEKMATFSAEDLERELNAQFNRFQELAGTLPDHIDSHHRAAYMHPAAFEVMLKLANEHDLPIRWADIQDDGYGFGLERAQLLREILETQGKPRSPEHIIDAIFDFKSGARLQRLITALLTVQDGYSEFVVHVGYGENLAEDYNFQRDEELVAVIDSSVKAVIEESEIQLCNFGDLPE